MGKLLLAALILGAGFMALARPWIGINSYYLLAILGPQYIWWWNFQGLRVSLIIALTTLLGVGFHIFKKGHYNFNFFLNPTNFWLLMLWFFISLSYFFGPYVPRFFSSGLTPAQLFYITNTMFIFYFAATLEMNETRKLRYLVMIVVASSLYLIYWANNQYLTQQWHQFFMGRLMGPASIDGGAIYKDSNAFSMFFVCTLPFIYYFGWMVKKQWLRWSLWAMIPLGWHAIFLTGSRGGLIGIGVIMLTILLLSKRKALILPLLLLFFVFYQWQAGDIMHERSEQIVNIEGERSASDRVTAWRGGLRMMIDQPLTGVGLGSFVTALPDYIESRHMVAHNTLIQFAAESGLGAGVAYVMLIYFFYVQSLKIRRMSRDGDESETEQIYFFNCAATASFTGLIVCSLFLSLNVYEIFFVLLLFNNALYHICLNKFQPTVPPSLKKRRGQLHEKNA